MEDRRGDLFDGTACSVDHRDALALHDVQRFLDFVATVVERSVLATRPAGLSDLLQTLGVDREPEQATMVGYDRVRKLALREVIGCQGEVRREDTELQRQVQRRGRFPTTRHA